MSRKRGRFYKDNAGKLRDQRRREAEKTKGIPARIDQIVARAKAQGTLFAPEERPVLRAVKVG